LSERKRAPHATLDSSFGWVTGISLSATSAPLSADSGGLVGVAAAGLGVDTR
jgi:hypothetical protein